MPFPHCIVEDFKERCWAGHHLYIKHGLTCSVTQTNHLPLRPSISPSLKIVLPPWCTAILKDET